MKYTRLSGAASVALLAALTAGAGLAQEAAPAADAAPAFASAEETAFIFNTLLFLIGGFLVMWMAAGFAMLEAGLVRTKNVAMQCTKNIALFSVAGIMYWLIGYNIMYPGDAWIIADVFGALGPKSIDAVGTADVSAGYSAGSDYFFQLMFCATTASIVSGTLAERIKLWPFLVFTVVLTGVIYPVEASWEWGAGWLDDLGFSDFAGSTLVHSAGGWAALAGALILGPRLGKYGSDGSVKPMPGSNLTLATLGTFILWLGWFGFNGASQLAMGTITDAADVSRIFVNTNVAAAAGALAALIVTQSVYGKVDLTMVLNGALAGLVSITAEPLAPSQLMSIVVGAIGGVIVVFAVPMLDKLEIDDVVGAIPVHLLAGIWGTVAVAITNSEVSIVAQLTGIAAIGAFVFVSSGVVWVIINATMGMRATQEQEMEGLDAAELGLEAYPEFGKGSQFA